MRFSEFAYSQVEETITPQTIHNLADKKNIPWDDEPSFLRLTKRLTGKEHLDDLNQSELQKIKRHLEKQGVAEGLNEFAISGDGGGDDYSLFNYAKMWYRGDYDTQQKVEHILARMGWAIGEVEDEEGGVFVVQQGDINGDSYLHFPVDDLSEGVAENFADGKNPGRKGLAKRSGVNTKASVSSLRKTAKHSSGEKARMAHWLANMKAGKAKHHKAEEDAAGGIVTAQNSTVDVNKSTPKKNLKAFKLI